MHFYDSVLLHMYKSFKVGWEHQRKGKYFAKLILKNIYVDGVSQQRVNEIYIEKIVQYMIGRFAFTMYINDS